MSARPTSSDSGEEARMRACRSPMRPQPASAVRSRARCVFGEVIRAGYLTDFRIPAGPSRRATWIRLRLLKLLISAGEASGDQHGARLLEALRERRPGLDAF